MLGRCHVWPRLTEFSGAALSCFTLSRLTIFPDVSLIKTAEDSVSPLFKAEFLIQCHGSGNVPERLQRQKQECIVRPVRNVIYKRLNSMIKTLLTFCLSVHATR